MKGRMWIGLMLFLLVYAAINGFVGWQGWLFAERVTPSLSPAAYWLAFAIVAFSYLLGRVKLPRAVRPIGRLLKVVGSYYFAVMEFALIIALPASLIGWIWELAGERPGDYALYAGWIAVGAIAIALSWGSRNAWSPVVRTYPVRIDKQAKGLDKLRIAAVSDIHLGNVVGRRHLKRLLAGMEALKPDVILLPGDVIDDSIEPFVRNRMSDLLRRLQARFGVYAVLGNHEYYGGHAEEYVGRMREIGIPVLRDEVVEIAGGAVAVAGRKDRTAESTEAGGRLSVQALLDGVDQAKPIILMDHQPYQFDKAAAAGADLLLCGHTHRGQFAPNHWLTKRLFELDWGYMRKGSMHVAVSSGFGSWGPPIRIASRSEIMLVEMTFNNCD